MNQKELIEIALKYYREAIQKEIRELHKEQMEWKKTKVILEDIEIEAKFTDEKYLLLINNRPFLLANVDNNDFEKTIENDKKTFGKVMYALYELETKGIVEKNLQDEKELEQFMKQFMYVLSFCNVKVGGQTISLLDFIQ